MKTKFFKKGLFTKVTVFIIIANFIFAGNVFASDSLRAAAAKVAKDGGTRKDIMKDLINNNKTPFLRIIPQNVHKGKGSSDVGSGLTIEQLAALIKEGLTSAFVGHTATRERYITEAITNLGATRDDAFRRFDEIVNGRIKELLKYEKIKEIHLGVGSDRKNLALEEEIEDISKQLEVGLKDIALADLQKLNFDISYEPSRDIKPLKDEELKEMIRQAHQFIYYWFAEKYGDEAIDFLWGRTLKVLFRGSVIKDNVKDNATPIMEVRIKTMKEKAVPGVHGVVFATSGKKADGYLGVAQVVNDAAKRDGLQYVVLVNLKSITEGDKDRTSSDEYVAYLYAALADGSLDRAFIIPEVAPPDVELEKWLGLVAEAEEAVRQEEKTENEVKAAKIKSEYIQEEETIYSVSGGGAWDNFVEKVLENSREILKIPALKVSVKQLSGNVAQVYWQFAGINIRKNFNFNRSPGITAAAVKEFNGIIPILEKNKLDLRKDEDYARAREIAAENLIAQAPVFNFISDELLPAMRKELSDSKRAPKILENNPHVFIVPPNVFKKGGMRNIIRKTAELNEVANINFAFYGYKTEELNDIIGIKNIITADNLDGLLKELANRNIEPADVIALIAPEDRDSDDSAKFKEAGIRQIVTPDITTLAMAKAVRESFSNFDFVRGAFNEFLSKVLIEDKIILAINSDAHMKIIEDLKEGVFVFPDQVKPNPDVIKVIEEAVNTEAFKKFTEEFI